MTSMHTEVGAYSLGLLEQQDREAFEAHLAGCPTCSAELTELSPLAGLLAGIGPVETAEPAGPAQDQPAEAAVIDLIRRRTAAQRRRGRLRAALGAAAALVLLAGGVAAGVAAAPQNATPALAGALHTATDPATHVTAVVGLVAMAWGTQVTMNLSHVRGPLDCELVAVSASGERRIVVGWHVPAAGYGVPGHPGHLIIAGGTAIPRKNLSRLEVRVIGGKALVTIPA